MKKTFIHGSKNHGNRKSMTRGFSFPGALMILFAFSMLISSVVFFERTELCSIEHRTEKLFQNIEEENLKVLETWKNYKEEKNAAY